jgi:hypothetical protein
MCHSRGIQLIIVRIAYWTLISKKPNRSQGQSQNRVTSTDFRKFFYTLLAATGELDRVVTEAIVTRAVTLRHGRPRFLTPQADHSVILNS